MLGFLAVASRENRVQFEHEIFFAYFLAKAFAGKIMNLPSGATLTQALLGKSLLPPHVGDFVAEQGECPPWAERVLRAVSGAADLYDPKGDTAARNTGELASGSLRRWSRSSPPTGLTLRSIVFGDVNLAGVRLDGSALVDVTFHRTQLLDAFFTRCTGDGVRFTEPLVCPGRGTLDIEGVDPAQDVWGLRLPTSELPEYEPGSVIDTLAQLGLPAAVAAKRSNATTPPALRVGVRAVLEKILRGYSSGNVLWPSDDQYRHFAGQPEWSLVTLALLDSGVIRPEERANQREKRTAWRIGFPPDQVLAAEAHEPASPEIARFWEVLRSRGM